MLQNKSESKGKQLEAYLASETWSPAQVINQLLGEFSRDSVADICQQAENAGVELLNEVDALIYLGSSKMDGLLDGLTQSLPKLDQDLRLLRYRSEQLVSSTANLTIEEDMLSELNDLRLVHDQKMQLAAELEALIDADAWNGLETDVVSALNQGNFLTAAKKYMSAQLSLDSNVKHPSYSPRSNLLYAIRQKMYAHYRTPFSDAISAKDGGSVKVLIPAYRILGATETPILHYAKQIVKPLASTSISSSNDVGWLCTKLCSLLHSDLDWILDAFKDLAPNVIGSTISTAISMARLNIQRYLESSVESQYIEAMACHHFIDQMIQFAEKTVITSLERLDADSEENFLTEAELKRSYFDRVQRPVLVRVIDLLRGTLDWLLPYQLKYSSHEAALIKSGTRDAVSTMVRCFNFTLGFGVSSLPSLLSLVLGEVLSEMEDTLSRIRADYILAHLKPNSDINWELFNATIKLFSKSLNVSHQITKYMKSFSVLFWPLKKGIRLSVKDSPAVEIQQFLNRDLVELEEFDGKVNLGSLTSLTILSGSSLNSQQLHKFLSQLTSSQVCFNQPLEQLAELHTSLGKVQFDILFQPLNSYLKAYLPSPKPKAGSFPKFEVPKFSLVPTSAISSLGERLLTLTQRLEPYTTEPSLFKYMLKINTELTPNDVLEVVEPPSKTEVLQTWISSLAHGAMTSFIQKIRENFAKSNGGSSLTQVHTDAAYLINVVTALGVSPCADLAFLSALSGMDPKRFSSFSNHLLSSSAEKDKLVETLSSYPEFDDTQDLCHQLLAADQALDPSSPGQCVKVIVASPDLVGSLLRTRELVSLI
ncbi:Golgi transport complex subunit 7 [Entomophthora muscae]|uniref:Golgi transport complex subunit 7 n=1 Tax=Entomophthora muscae TaxID=34485 RepID=A0ACC2TD66_9FUNG|nr:Golgi transport complex subunit 7 [Entomophthora muscae]